MANRDPELGEYGLFDSETTKKLGLKAALTGTICHLEYLINVSTGKKKEELMLERSRLISKRNQC